jgi:hypothetical protein
MRQTNERDEFWKLFEDIEKIQSDHGSIIDEGMKKYGGIENLPNGDEIYADRDVVLKAVKKRGGALQFADKSLINDASFFWQIWNMQKSETGDDYRKAYINQYLLKETAKILLGAIVSGILLSGITIPLVPALIVLIAGAISAIYTGYKVAEHGYGFFKAKYEPSTSKIELVSVL